MMCYEKGNLPEQDSVFQVKSTAVHKSGGILLASCA